MPECAEEHGYLRARVYLSLLEDARVDNADNNQTGDDQSESDEGYKEDAASAGGEFTPYDPILDSILASLYCSSSVSSHVADIPGSQNTFFLRQARLRLQFLEK